ncbi:MAG TPA: acetate kinase [Clostridiales bacterium]|nr:MAG: acetate kinase [Clostridiales bacterium GWD2_32_19]HCC06647.1 acetate kinase [Clostridiales bacterium]
MKVLVVNCGSSSLKYQLLDMETEVVLAKGYAEKVGIEGTFTNHQANGDSKTIYKQLNNHKEAIQFMIELLTDKENGVISDINEIDAVGHRVVHGGESFNKSVIIDADVKEAIKKFIPLAPLHNPANLTGVLECEKILSNVPMVAVFDTAFHQTMEKVAYLYALPYEYYEKYGVRRYGFHGTSHKYIASKVGETLNKSINDLKIISCHLGNGASVCAINKGKVQDTSMGFTPLEGLMMGTRCGDIDPAIIKYLHDKEGLTIEQIDTILNQKSGLLGVSGISSDMRDIEKAIEEGNERAKVSIDMFEYEVVKYIGAYVAAMNGVDVIAFTAGVGENDIGVREKICEYLQFLGITIDKEANSCRGKLREISTSNSKIKVMVVPTNEELTIARDTKEVVDNK